MLRSHLLSCLMRRSTVCPREEIIIDYGLVAKFDGMPFCGHPEVVWVSDEVRYIV